MARSLVPPLLVRVVLLIAAVIFGEGWRWGHLDEDVGDDADVSACRGFVLYLVRCSLFKRLNFGELFLLYRLMMGLAWCCG